MTNPVDRFPDWARPLLTASGRDLLDRLGLPALRAVVTDVLLGENVRGATETLTRLRLSHLNAALLLTYARLLDDGIDPLAIPPLARTAHRRRGASDDDRKVLRWMLGLTNKQVENVLRSDDAAWDDYVADLGQTLGDAATTADDRWGPSPLEFAGRPVSWEWLLSLLMAVGAQTLGIRGSEKSLYGKFFEKLVLGSVLSVLGFRLVGTERAEPRSFWLSTRGNKRESDATAIWARGQGVRFDIGFIGPGNPEITLDKTSRFERQIEIDGYDHFMHTFVIVDRVGARSRVPELAAQIGATVIQMSADDWVRTLGEGLAQTLDGYTSPLVGMDDQTYAAAIRAGVDAAPLEAIFERAVDADPDTGD